MTRVRKFIFVGLFALLGLTAACGTSSDLVGTPYERLTEKQMTALSAYTTADSENYDVTLRALINEGYTPYLREVQGEHRLYLIMGDPTADPTAESPHIVMSLTGAPTTNVSFSGKAFVQLPPHKSDHPENHLQCNFRPAKLGTPGLTAEMLDLRGLTAEATNPPYHNESHTGDPRTQELHGWTCQPAVWR